MKFLKKYWFFPAFFAVFLVLDLIIAAVFQPFLIHSGRFVLNDFELTCRDHPEKTWNRVFFVVICALFLMGSLCFVLFLIFEKRGIIRFNRVADKKQAQQGFKESARVLLKHRIAKFALVALITGVIRTTVVF